MFDIQEKGSRLIVDELKLKLTPEENQKISEPFILLFLGFYLAQAGKIEEAYPIVKKTIEIDPLSALSHMIEGWYYFLKGDFEHAIVSTKKSYEIERENPQFCFFYTCYMAHNNQIHETHSIVQEGKKNMPDNAWTWL